MHSRALSSTRVASSCVERRVGRAWAAGGKLTGIGTARVVSTPVAFALSHELRQAASEGRSGRQAAQRGRSIRARPRSAVAHLWLPSPPTTAVSASAFARAPEQLPPLQPKCAEPVLRPRALRSVACHAQSHSLHQPLWVRRRVGRARAAGSVLTGIRAVSPVGKLVALVRGCDLRAGANGRSVGLAESTQRHGM